MFVNPADILPRLVATASVNPMGQDVWGPEFGEAKLTEFLETVFASLGLEHHRDPVHPGRDNLVARLDGEVAADRGGRLVLLGAHQDTVPTEGMTIEPFEPRVEAGRLYGRGSCDVKGGMAAVLAAVARLARERPRGMPTVIIACTVNEECGFSGARSLAQWCQGPGGGLIPRRPDAAVIAEPTELDVVVAHKGVVRWKCHTAGRAGHSARPEAGQNAIYKMAPLLDALERYHREVLPQLGSHPLCGRATLSVGTIRGGVSVNTIPDQCTIEVDRRLRPDEDPADAYRHLVEHLQSRHPSVEASHDPPYMQGPPLPDAANGPLAERLSAVAAEVAGRGRRVGVPYATDAAFLAAAGVPTVVFGPGSIEQAHTRDEWISLEQLDQAAEILYRFLAES